MIFACLLKHDYRLFSATEFKLINKEKKKSQWSQTTAARLFTLLPNYSSKVVRLMNNMLRHGLLCKHYRGTVEASFAVGWISCSGLVHMGFASG